MSNSTPQHRSRLVRLAITTALASTTLTGCGVFKADEAKLSADAPKERGVQQPTKQARKAIDRSENVVLADPRSSDARVALGATYLQAGRFHSAEQSFAEAMELGADGADVIVSRSLALVANGNFEAAHRLLRDYQDMIDPADLGLAFSLAGDPQRGSRILANALRSGQNTAKVRQNFAYSLALGGEWRSARLMVAEDVPADQVGTRIKEWAATAHNGAHQQRIANLLGVTPVADSGRPQALALVNHPTVESLAVEASETAPVDAFGIPEATPALASADTVDLAPADPANPDGFDLADFQIATKEESADEVEGPVRVAVAASDAATPAKPVAPTAKPAVVEAAVVAETESAPAPVKAKPQVSKPAVKKAVVKRADASSLESGNHMVQLGSFLKKEHAERAWDIYTSRYPELKGTQMALTEAEIDGTRYYRVAAANLAQGSANALCSSVKRSGHGCFAYAKTTKLPGTLDRGVRMASNRS